MNQLFHSLLFSESVVGKIHLVVMDGADRVIMTGVVSVVRRPADVVLVVGGKRVARRTSAAYLKAACSKRVLTKVLTLKGLMHPFFTEAGAGARHACSFIPEGRLASDMSALEALVVNCDCLNIRENR